ncbi:hypothetical protein LE181_25380 [Streptomyces sp. SCA3-4]|uniref:hypothetical protein n=1 Tax=Streptomyces sichuanensis TaxID=2871810 RepID=UPI001CE38C7C|nr:hypothetical protein [Streptomyces sichuanensis]MCA6095487.1 hypothetical protein [Streptomyces sichuanensis]
MTSLTWTASGPPTRPVPHGSGRRRARAALAVAGCAAALAATSLARRRGGAVGPFPGERLMKGASVVGGLALAVLASAGPTRPRARRIAEPVALGAAAALVQGGSQLLFDALAVALHRTTGPADQEAAVVDAPRVAARCLALGSAALTVSAVRQRPVGGARTCTRCGRPLRGDAPRFPSWSGYAACALSLPYPVVKLAWECGSDVGITRPDVIHNIPGGWLPVVPALAGSVLSLALVRPWGRVFPRWVPAVGGSRVPRPLVLAPASFAVAVLAQVAPAALVTAVRHSLDPLKPSVEEIGLRSWVPFTFYACWLLWGIALAGAAWEYHRAATDCPCDVPQASGPAAPGSLAA